MKHLFPVIVLLVAFAPFPLFGQTSPNCFLEDFETKDVEIPPSVEAVKPTDPANVIVTITGNDTIARVSKYLYGNNSNPYMTQMVDQPKLIEYIQLLSPNVIRFPGGNLSSVFFWNSTSQPPADAPSKLIDGNTGKEISAGYWYGRNSAGWTLSVDNYYQMLDLTNNTAIITINYSYARYGTGTDPVAAAAHYAADWVRYDDGRTKFWEIGNENAGPWQAGFLIDTTMNKDGQPRIISGELYGKHFKVFADSMRKAAQDMGNSVYIGAQLIQYDAVNSWNPPDRTWNNGFFSQAGDAADFYIVHSYYTNYNENSRASVILNSAATESKNMMDYIQRNTASNHVQMKPLALTEWNIFAVGSKQSCSFVSGMHAALVLGELIKNQYSMASRWDLANGYDNGNDHGMFSQGDEPDVPKWNPRPAFFYMYYFQKYFGDHMVKSSITGSKNFAVYASSFGSGPMGLVVVNKDTAEKTVRLDVKNFGCGERYYLYTLTGGKDNGEFSQVVHINDYGPTHATGGPIDELESIEAYAYPVGNEIQFTSPGRSVEYVLIENGENDMAVNEKGNNVDDGGPAKVMIYPTPARESLRIDLKQGGYHRIDIVNIQGSIVYSGSVNPAQRELRLSPRLPSGYYFVRLSGIKKTAVSKLVICK